MPARGFSVHVDRLFRRKGRAEQGVDEIAFWFGSKLVWGIEIKTAAQGCGFLDGDKHGMFGTS